VNKIDAIADKKAWEKTAESVRVALGSPVQVFPISAKNGEGVNELKMALKNHLPVGRPFFPTDQVTDRWERYFTAELIRESLFKAYAQEVPHASAVVIDEFVEKPGQKDHIKALIFVETEGQKKILIGEGGRSIKSLGQQSRAEIEKMLGRPVFLELLVKVRKNWRKDTDFIRKMRDGEL
jgi:GTP-binding protein Era